MTTAHLDPVEIRRVVRAALAEDLGEAGDITSAALIPAGTRGRARFVTREAIVVAGLAVAEEVFRELDAGAVFARLSREGDAVASGTVIAEVVAGARALLAGERTALNLLQRMSGIATAARDAVREVEGTHATILDTRKTAPGLRHFDKYAVAVGGATNHRMGLHDAILIKDTHRGVVPSIREAVRRAIAAGHPPSRVTIEVSSPEELAEAIDAGAGRALLDNMSLETLRRCVAIGRGRIELEASGSLRPGSLRAVAETGVDHLSIGSLTHSSRAVDLAMDLEIDL